RAERVLLRRRRVLPTLRVVLGHVQVVVSLHALAIAFGVGAAAFIAVRRASAAIVAVPVVAFAALVGAHGLFVLLHGGGGGGLASTGGIAAGLIATCLVARLARPPPAVLLDAIVAAALVALGNGRVGCSL